MRRMKYTQFATVVEEAPNVKALILGDIIEETITYEDMELEEITMDAITLEAQKVKNDNETTQKRILMICPVGYIAKVPMQKLVS